MRDLLARRVSGMVDDFFGRRLLVFSGEGVQFVVTDQLKSFASFITPNTPSCEMLWWRPEAVVTLANNILVSNHVDDRSVTSLILKADLRWGHVVQ